MAEVGSMCADCHFDELKTSAFFEGFTYDEKSMDYYDGPLSGWMMCKKCGCWFAFDCSIIIEAMLWHWALIPAEKTADARQAILAASEDREGWWLSVLEDRRSGADSQYAVRIPSITAKPALSVAIAPRRTRS